MGGTCGLPELFGVKVQPAAYRLLAQASNLGEGYLEKGPVSHPVLDHLTAPLHFFGGISVLPDGGQLRASVLDAHGRATPRAGVVEQSTGDGLCLLIAADLTGSVVRIQQGTAISRDGVPAPDGTAPVADTILKTDDGLVLDWLFDRQPVPGVDGMSAFLQPVADLWREVLLRAIFYAATWLGLSLPLLWLYPRNLPALAELSHDTDLNVPELAWHLLEVLKQADVHSSWCVLLPGYPPEVITAIREAGHELAMHYDAFSTDRPWGEPNFQGQRQVLTEMFGGQAPVTNKNHYLRWEGDSEFWEWCVASGIQLDQSKGPSKTGGVGFPFGTCHPYLPLDPGGHILDVLELPTLTQDLVLTAPLELAPPMLAAVLKSHGVFHLLFHPNHIRKPGQSAAVLSATALARAAGLEWWTAAEINRWERARRQTCWHGAPNGAYTLSSTVSLHQATLLCLESSSGQPANVAINGVAQDVQVVERWGYRFQSVVLDLIPHSEYRLEVV